MELCRSLSVDRRLSDNDTLADHLLVLLLFLKLRNDGLNTDEGDDSLSIRLSTNHIHLIAHLDCCATLRDDQLCATKNARANEVTLQEIVDLKNCATREILILHDEVHEIRLCRCF